jgi:adenylate cyclase
MDTPALSTMFQFGRFRFCSGSDGLLRQDTTGVWRPVSIGSRARAVLGVLIEQRGNLVLKDQIMRSVWPETSVEEHNLTVQISALRRLLDGDHPSESCIQTVTGRGYRFRPMMASQADDPFLKSSMQMPNSRPRLSLVVLPFKNLAGNSRGDDLAEAITDELSTDLSSWSAAFVIAGKTAGALETGPVDIRQLGLELGVNYVIHGSVRGSRARTSVNVRLIDVETGAYLWADRFHTDHRAAPDAREEIIGRLQRALVQRLLEDATRRIEALPPRDWSSYDLSMRGRTFMSRPQSLANRRTALDCFEQALDRNQGSALARIGIANVLITNILEGWSTSVEEDTVRAEHLLLQALDGDTDISQVHTYMGMLRRIQGRLSDSRLELEIALGMSPNLSHAMSQLGVTLAFLGLPEDAIPWLEKSLRLAPHDHGTPVDQAALGLCHLMMGKIESGVVWLRKARAGNPRMYYIHMWLAAGLGLNDELDEAAASLRQAIQIKPDIDSLTALRSRWQMMTASSRFFVLAEKTVVLGLQRAGLPEKRV